MYQIFTPPFTGSDCYHLVERLYPIMRSLTGPGFRKSLEVLKEYVLGIKTLEFKSGTQVFDWTIPQEWDCTECYIEDETGHRLIDMQNQNLHVLGYSLPIDEYLSFEDLKKLNFVDHASVDAIPYVTSYYQDRVGFCMSKNQLEDIERQDQVHPQKYHAVIKSRKFDGVLNIGEYVIKGKSDKEILFTTYLCHPQMANNECSGPAVAIALIKYLEEKQKEGNLQYSYRFLFTPETVGSITYLAHNLDYLKEHVISGIVLTCVGDNLAYSYVQTRYNNTVTDRVLNHVLKWTDKNFKAYSFLYRGSDERQYNAPRVDLPVCSFCRSKFGCYKEYHTSLDDLNFVSVEGFEGSIKAMLRVIEILEHNHKYQVTVFCEPQLGKRGLYPTISYRGSANNVFALRNFIAYADGTMDFIEHCEKIGYPAFLMIETLDKLLAHGLIKAVD